MAVPGPPPVIGFGTITPTSIAVVMQDGANGGKPITVRQMGISTNNAGIQNTVNIDGLDNVFGNLAQGTAYYFWARSGNADGWGPWAGPVGRTTPVFKVPDKPTAISVSDITEDSFFVAMADGSNNGSAITVRQMGLSTNNTGIQQSYNITGLDHQMGPLASNTQYYVWARSGNAIGWGPYAGPVAVRTKSFSLPSRPGSVTFRDITGTTVTATFADGDNGGLAIDARQIVWGTNATTHQFVANTRPFVVTGLAPRTLYYFWSRVHTAAGWSDWSVRTSVTTDGIPASPAAPTLATPTQTSVYATFPAPADSGSPILEYQIGHSLAADRPITFIPSNRATLVSALVPGREYYFWARARNAVGWSPWSTQPSKVRLVTGARVRVGAVYQLAVPYVRVNGVWRLARPKVRSAGVWKDVT